MSPFYATSMICCKVKFAGALMRSLFPMISNEYVLVTKAMRNERMKIK